MLRHTLRWTALFVGLLLVFAMLVFLGQRRLVYFPEREPMEDATRRARRLRAEPWIGPTGTRLGWRLPHPSGRADLRILVLHGNAGSALDRAYFPRVFQAAGLPPAEVCLLEYPGYGPVPGNPGEGTLVAQALEGVDALNDRPLLLCGESLGGAVACLAAAQRPREVRGLILVAPMKSLAEVGARHYPYLPTFLLRDRFQADRALAAYPGPAAFLVPGSDEVVFPDLIASLREAHRGPHRTWQEPGATHNSLTFDPALPRWEEMLRFALGEATSSPHP